MYETKNSAIFVEKNYQVEPQSLLKISNNCLELELQISGRRIARNVYILHDELNQI